ncbi:LmbE family protein [Agaricicola taiwanensis]|uniref:LmbE family protein n=1 Tax=Agaricicola taiwanensis TaxID=591372 RepID=A0A8J2VNW1_9RHOB|nr:PIG-L deacetylase family protein [Agaricicola taiwanensis]GGE35089.1 LmbE family protein [Agaricicola taiwanensis]
MMTESAAVVVAHPDDEVLACGGTIAKLAARGVPVHVLILATGLAARGAPDKAALETLRGHASRAITGVLGCASVSFADFPDNRMDSVPLLDVVKRVEEFLGETGADTVFTHHPGDVNIDHGVTAHATLTATRPLPGSPIRRVWAGEVISSSEWGFPERRFVPNAWVDISDTLDAKIAAMDAYIGELRDFPHPRSLEALKALGLLRGSEIGVAAAEAFQILRQIER